MIRHGRSITWRHVLLAAVLLVLLPGAVRAAEPPRLVLQTPHTKTVTAMAIDAHGKWLATGGEDGEIGIWDLQTGYRAHTLSGHMTPVTAIRFGRAQTGLLIMSVGAHDPGVMTWTVSDSNEIHAERYDLQWLGMVSGFDAGSNRDGANIAAAAGVYGIDLFTPDLPSRFKHLQLDGKLLRMVAIDPAGHAVATLSQDGDLTHWSLAPGAVPVSRLLQGDSHVSLMRFSRTGELQAVRTESRATAGAPDSTPQLVMDVWDARGKLVTSTIIRNKCIMTPLAISEDRQIAVVIGAYRTFMHGAFHSGIDSTTGCDTSRLAVVQANPDSTVSVLDIDANGLAVAAFDRNATMLAVGFENGNVSRLALQRDGANTMLQQVVRMGGSGMEPVAGLAVLDQGKTLAVGAGRQVTVWDLQSGRPRQEIAAAQPVTSVAGHQTATVFAVAEENGRVTVLNNLGDQLYQRDLDGRDPHVALSKNGRLLAVGFEARALDDASPLLSLIDFTTTSGYRKGTVRQLPRVAHSVQSLAFNDTSSLLASGHMRQFPTPAPYPLLRLWHTASLAELPTPLAGSQSSILALAFQPATNLLAIGSGEGLLKPDQNFALWDTDSGRFIHTDADTGINNAIAVNPAGTLAAVGSLRASRASLTIRFEPTEPRSSPATSAPDVGMPAFPPLVHDPALMLWNPRTGTRVAGLTGHSASISALAFNGNQQLFSASEDGTVRLWTMPADHAGKPLQLAPTATLMHFREPGAWLVAHGDGRFDADNMDRLRNLAWTFADDPHRVFPAEIFMRDYYTPGLLAQLTQGCQPGQCTAPATAAIVPLNRVQPRVAIAAVRPGTIPGEVLVEVTASGVHDPSQRNGKQQSDVYDLRLFRNGQLVGQYPRAAGSIGGASNWSAWRDTSRLPGAALDNRTHIFNVTLPQHAKDNRLTLTAYAFNEDRVKSRTETWQDRPPPASVNLTPASKPRAYVITIGVDAYAGPLRSLSYAVKDARDMSVALEKIDGYDVVPLMLLSGRSTTGAPVRQATKATIRAVIERLAGIAGTDHDQLADVQGIDPVALGRLAKATPDDLVILTFSGHGYASASGEFYLLPSGSTAADPFTADGLQQLISSEDLSTWLRDVDAGQLAMIIDACHAAGIVDSPGFKPGPLGDKGLGQLAYDKGMIILAATQASDVALEVQNLRQGLLTFALTNSGLAPDPARPERRRADLDGDGRLTLAEWLRFGAAEVPLLYAAIRDNKLPQLRRDAVPADKQWREKIGRSGQKPSLFDFRQPDHEAVLLPATPPPTPGRLGKTRF